MTNTERFEKAQKIAEIINANGVAKNAGKSAGVTAAAWQKADMIRVYIKDGRGYMGRDLGYLDVDADGDLTGYSRLNWKAAKVLDDAGVETFA